MWCFPHKTLHAHVVRTSVGHVHCVNKRLNEGTWKSLCQLNLIHPHSSFAELLDAAWSPHGKAGTNDESMKSWSLKRRRVSSVNLWWKQRMHAHAVSLQSASRRSIFFCQIMSVKSTWYQFVEGHFVQAHSGTCNFVDGEAAFGRLQPGPLTNCSSQPLPPLFDGDEKRLEASCFDRAS